MLETIINKDKSYVPVIVSGVPDLAENSNFLSPPKRITRTRNKSTIATPIYLENSNLLRSESSEKNNSIVDTSIVLKALNQANKTTVDNKKSDVNARL